MGVSISSPNLSNDMGYGGFRSLRRLIASCLPGDWFSFYDTQFDAWDGGAWDAYVADLERRASLLDESWHPVIDFLYAPDTDCELDAAHCAAVLRVTDTLEPTEGKRVYGYAAHKDACTFTDFCDMLRDGVKSGVGIRWR